MNLAEIWRRITTTAYARALEAELTGERAEIAEQRCRNRPPPRRKSRPPKFHPRHRRRSACFCVARRSRRNAKSNCRRATSRSSDKSFAPTREFNPARRRANAPPFLAPNPPPPRIRIRAKRKAQPRIRYRLRITSTAHLSFCTAGLRAAPLPSSSTGIPACANVMPQHYRARQARTRHRSVRRLYATSNQLSHHFLASRRTAHSNLRHRQECLCHHLSTAARSQILGAYHDIVLFFASAVSDSRGTACRARTRHMHARAIHAPCRYKRFASEFLHRDEWRDAAKFLCRARHAVPLLKSHLARRFFVAPASSRPFCLSLCTKRNARSAAKRKFKNAGRDAVALRLRRKTCRTFAVVTT